MYIIIIIIIFPLSLQSFDWIHKYTNEPTSKLCKYIKIQSIKYAIKAEYTQSPDKFKQYEDLADILFEDNKRCILGEHRQKYGKVELITR